jgi:hypothetical protein
VRHVYSSFGRTRPYCAYDVHPNTPSRHSTSRRSVAQALVVRPVAPFRGSTTPCAARPGASARRPARHAARPPLVVDYSASRRLVVDSSLTTSTTPRVWVPRHVARLVTQLVVDYFAYAARPGARDVARLVTRLVVDYFASRRLVVDYFTYAARPVASARRAACRVTRHRLLCHAQARRRLLRLRRASGCLGTSRGSSRGSSRRSSSTTPPRAGSSSTTSPTPRARVPRHVARLVKRLVA